MASKLLNVDDDDADNDKA